MKNLKTNIFAKIGIIIILIALLMIPTIRVKNLIDERNEMQTSAIDEVSDKWGKGQTIIGPYISIPYKKGIRNFAKGGKQQYSYSYQKMNFIYILPDNLEVNGEIIPEKRYRGVYEIVLYESNIALKGNFKNIDFEKLNIDPEDVAFDKATLNIGITDLKGVEKQVSLKWNKKEVLFNPGTEGDNISSSGINAPVLITKENYKNGFTFSTNLNLKGSQFLYFTPVGKTTDVTITSDWKTPSFTGTFLPDSREVTNNGFISNWNILHLNRNFPQTWIGNSYEIQTSSFGTDLIVSVDNYKKSYRVARYAILFLVLTFVTFFFVEILKKVFIHPIQYLLVGVAIIIFYVLLLSISEHFNFNLAYIISALATLVLITVYITTILKSKAIGALISGILLVLYTFIFTIIQLEDYALLIGSIGMFIILSLGMYFSRKIDWYSIKLGASEVSETKIEMG